MELLALADYIADARRKIAAIIACTLLDEYQKKALLFVLTRLNQMETECRSSTLKPVAERYPEIGRIVEESDPAVLPPEVGGQLIDVEKAYMQI